MGKTKKQLVKELESLIQQFNQTTKSFEYEQEENIIEQIMNIYIDRELPIAIRELLKTQIMVLLETEKNPYVEENPLIIKIGNDFIRKGAWQDGSEDEENLKWLHPENISKYVPGFTCSSIKYEYDYPNQVVEILDDTTTNQNQEFRGRRIYRLEQDGFKTIQTISRKVEEGIYYLDKRIIIPDHSYCIKKTAYYKQAPDSTIEIIENSERVKKIKL